MSLKFRYFAFFSSSRLRDPIWDPPGLRFGSLLAPKIVENCLEIRLGAPKGRSRALWVGPEGVQERSKRPPGGKNKGIIRATMAKRLPRGLQDPSGSHFVAILEPF